MRVLLAMNELHSSTIQRLRHNPAVERDSQQAALVGSLRASRSGCPSLPR
jgi:hypothetical protein